MNLEFIFEVSAYEVDGGVGEVRVFYTWCDGGYFMIYKGLLVQQGMQSISTHVW